MEARASSRPRKLALLALAAAHLVVVVVGILHVDIGGRAAARAVMYYAELSGASGSYDFFAPAFDALPRAVFAVTERETTRADVLGTGVSREVDFRLRSGVFLFSLLDAEGQRAIAVSLAREILARHPAADAVVVRIVSFSLPRMEDYRRGAIAGDKLLFEATFTPSSARRAQSAGPSPEDPR